MWRSILSKSRYASRSLDRIPASKVLSSSVNVAESHPRSSPNSFPALRGKAFAQNFRFFSANPTEDIPISSDAGFSSVESGVTSEGHGESDASDLGFADSVNLGVDDSVPEALVGVGEDGNEGDGFSENSPERFSENGDVQADDSRENVHKVDVENLEGVLSLLRNEDDGSLESRLNGFDIDLQEDFVVRVLGSPDISGRNLIRFFKWAMRKQDFSVTNRVVEALVVAVCGDARKLDAYNLWDLIKELGGKENSVLNLEILNELAAVFGKLGKAKAAFDVFTKVEEFGFSPDARTYYLTLEVLFKRSFIEWACFVSGKMLEADVLPESSQVGNIISWLCKEGKAEEAYSVYVLAKEKNKCPPRRSVVTLINSLCRKNETVTLAQDMLGDFSEDARRHEIKPFSDVVRGLCRMENVKEAKTLLLDMISRGPAPGNAVFNFIINAYSKTGDLDEAKEMIKLIKSRGLRPDVYAYTVIISGYAKGGLMDEACEVLAEAKKIHKKLSPVTYHALIRGYCKIEEYNKALNLLGEMDRFGVQPNADEYNKLVQSLCLKALDWGTAEKLLEEMKQKGLHLSAITRALIQAVKELESESMETRNQNLLAEA